MHLSMHINNESQCPGERVIVFLLTSIFGQLGLIIGGAHVPASLVAIVLAGGIIHGPCNQWLFIITIVARCFLQVVVVGGDVGNNIVGQ